MGFRSSSWDGSTFFQPAQAVVKTCSVYIHLPVGCSEVVQSADGKVGLVQLDGATPVAARIVFGIIGGKWSGRGYTWRTLLYSEAWACCPLALVWQTGPVNGA